VLGVEVFKAGTSAQVAGCSGASPGLLASAIAGGGSTGVCDSVVVWVVSRT
jgi:hypothetical protein